MFIYHTLNSQGPLSTSRSGLSSGPVYHHVKLSGLIPIMICVAMFKSAYLRKPSFLVMVPVVHSTVLRIHICVGVISIPTPVSVELLQPQLLKELFILPIRVSTHLHTTEWVVCRENVVFRALTDYYSLDHMWQKPHTCSTACIKLSHPKLRSEKLLTLKCVISI